MSTEIITIESIGQIVTKNKPIIAEKVSKAIEALSRIQKIDDDDEAQDKLANDILAKCNATLPIVEGLRKEYTSIVDDWKKFEMQLETNLKKEMDRVRALRNERANRLAEQTRAKNAEIEKKRLKDIEIAKIKADMALSVELGISQRIIKGEEAIADMFNKLTLENFDEAVKKFDFKPALKEDFFRGLLKVTYNKDLVSEQEFEQIDEKAFIHFDFNKCNKAYIDAVLKVIGSWKVKLPARRIELEKIAKASGEEAERLRKQAEDRAKSDAKQREDAAKANELATAQKAQETKANAALDAEFSAQVATQSIETQHGTRGAISYRLKEDLKPMQIVEIMGRSMVSVLSDPSFKGIFKRDKAGMPKRDARGQAEYIDAVQCWLDLLVKVKPSPDIEGLIKTEDVITIAKK